MSSRWLVLLVALAACRRLGCAQADPLPLSLVDLVMNSPISSMKDLQELMDDHSVEEEENGGQLNGTQIRLPRSLADVQVAQQAVCKVRTEVMEVTRSMFDRTNANFLLWPLCVEVQRCSGCCNTRTLQCVPVTSETRRLQMIKITFVKGQPSYDKVIIPVEDHLTCSCKSRTASHATWTKTTTPLPPPRIPTKATASKTQSKEELHRLDDLKHNQRFQLDDRETQWQTKHSPGNTPRTPVHTPTHSHNVTHTSYVNQSNLDTKQAGVGVIHMSNHTTEHKKHHKSDEEHHSGHHKHRSEHHTHHSESEKVPEHHTHHSESGKASEHHTHHSKHHTHGNVEQHTNHSVSEKAPEHDTHHSESEKAPEHHTHHFEHHAHHSESGKASEHHTHHSKHHSHHFESGKVEQHTNHTVSEKAPEHHTHHSESGKASQHHTHHSESGKASQHHTHHSESGKASQHHTHHSESEKTEHHVNFASGDDTIKVTASIKHYHKNHSDQTTKPQPQSHPTNHSQSEISLQHSGQMEAPILRFSDVEVIGQSSSQSELFGQSSSQSEAEKHHHQHRHHPTRTPTHHPTRTPTRHPSSTRQAVMNAPPSKPPLPHTPPPAIAQRKRRRKQRRRMSKSAMRAMIMVMS